MALLKLGQIHSLVLYLMVSLAMLLASPANNLATTAAVFPPLKATHGGEAEQEAEIYIAAPNDVRPSVHPSGPESAQDDFSSLQNFPRVKSCWVSQ